MKMELIDVTKMFKFNKKYYLIFKELNFTFYSHLFYYIYGEAASGKTTLLDIIGFQTNINEGKILINSNDVDSEDKSYYKNKSIGYAREDMVLNPTLTVKENIMIPIKYRQDLNKVMKDKIAVNLLADFRMEEKADYLAEQLTETEKQKTSIMRALINEPHFILLDEPFRKLDYETKEMLKSKLKNLAIQGSTIILTSKDLPDEDIKCILVKIENKSLVKING